MRTGKKNSLKIGSFTMEANGILYGKIFGLGLGATRVKFEPQTSRDGKDYYRLIAAPLTTAYEIGVAFPREKDGLAYHAVNIESPVLPGPLNAALFLDKESGSYDLVWSRRDEARELQADATAGAQENGAMPSRWTSAKPSPR